MPHIHLLYPVKYIIAALLCLSAATTYAQHEEKWDTYVAMFGDKYGSVLVDMARISSAPDKSLPYLVVTGPRAHKCDKRGIPDKEEIDMLEAILDATGSFLTGATPKALVGTFTSNCERLNYYYVKDTTAVRNAIARMYNRNYKDYSYKISIRPDAEWSTYRTFLYPTDETKKRIEQAAGKEKK